jgi:hypothetical protein
MPELAAEIKAFLTHSGFLSPSRRIACVMAVYSGSETRVDMNFPRASFLGSFGRPILAVFMVIFIVHK